MKFWALTIFLLFGAMSAGSVSAAGNPAEIPGLSDPARTGISVSAEIPTMLPVPVPSWGLSYKIYDGRFAYGIKGTMNLLVLDRHVESTRLLILPAYSIGLLFERHFSDYGLLIGVSPGFRYFFGDQGVLNPALPAAINTVDAVYDFSIKEFFLKPYLGYQFSDLIGLEVGYFVPVYDWNIFSTQVVRDGIAENNSPIFQTLLESGQADFKRRVADLKSYYLNVYFAFVIRL